MVELSLSIFAPMFSTTRCTLNLRLLSCSVYHNERLSSAIDRLPGSRQFAADKGDGRQTVLEFPVSQAELPSTYSLLRSLSVVRTLRHFQTVGLSRQDRLDDVE
jgi:hypothetical protein